MVNASRLATPGCEDLPPGNHLMEEKMPASSERYLRPGGRAGNPAGIERRSNVDSDTGLPFPTFIDAAGMGRLLFISPHLDDAAFACGRLLASVSDAIVATLFAGVPAPYSALTEWDRAAGFKAGDDVVARRREEDRQALGQLGAWPLWLELQDRQYGPEPSLDQVVARLVRLLFQCEPDAVFFPLGLFHSDHQLTRQAASVLVRACSGCRWFAYEDALYRRLPAQREEALADLRRAGLGLSAARFVEAPDAASCKERAVACYASQLRALATPGRPGNIDLFADEAYWLVRPAK